MKVYIRNWNSSISFSILTVIGNSKSFKIYIYTHMQTYVCIYRYIYNKSMYIYMCVYIYTHIYMYVRVYIERDLFQIFTFKIFCVKSRQIVFSKFRMVFCSRKEKPKVYAGSFSFYTTF